MKEPDHDLVDEGKTSKFHPKFDGTPLRVLSQGMTWLRNSVDGEVDQTEVRGSVRGLKGESRGVLTKI